MPTKPFGELRCASERAILRSKPFRTPVWISNFQLGLFESFFLLKTVRKAWWLAKVDEYQVDTINTGQIIFTEISLLSQNRFTKIVSFEQLESSLTHRHCQLKANQSAAFTGNSQGSITAMET